MSLSRPAVTVSLQVLAATVSPNGRARHDLGTARKRRVHAIQILVGELVAYHRKRARTSHLSAATRFVPRKAETAHSDGIVRSEPGERARHNRSQIGEAEWGVFVLSCLGRQFASGRAERLEVGLSLKEVRVAATLDAGPGGRLGQPGQLL